MKLTHFTPLVFAVLVAAASASPYVARSDALTHAQAESQATELLQSFSSKLQAEDKKIKQLDPKDISLDEIKPITQDLVELVNKLGAGLNDILKKIQEAGSKAEQEKRQALLVPAVNQLVSDLNTVLADVEPLLRHLTSNLELGTVQDIVDGLSPALATLVGGVESLLTTLAPGLSSLVDPLLHAVYSLTNALGLPLNLPSIQ